MTSPSAPASDSSRSPSKLTPPALGHVGLAVRDRDRSRVFYQRLLGYELLGEKEVEGVRLAFLGLDGAVLLTLWQTAGADFDATAAGLHHLAFRAANAAELATYAERLAELGVELHHGGPVRHAEGADTGGLFFRGPDRERLEISAAGVAALDLPSTSGPACGFF